MKLTRINLDKLVCKLYRGIDLRAEGSLTAPEVSQSNCAWVKSFSTPVFELRVYSYDGQEIGAIVEEVADIDTIKGWLTELPA